MKKLVSILFVIISIFSLALITSCSFPTDDDTINGDVCKIDPSGKGDCD